MTLKNPSNKNNVLFNFSVYSVYKLLDAKFNVLSNSSVYSMHKMLHAVVYTEAEGSYVRQQEGSPCLHTVFYTKSFTANNVYLPRRRVSSI